MPDRGVGSRTALEDTISNNHNSNHNHNHNHNYSRLPTPSQPRQDMYSFIQSPFPGLSSDLFGETAVSDALQFDEGWRDLGSRTDFYENLNSVLSGSYS